MSEVRRLERVEAPVMEPLYDGSFRESTVDKYAWQCLGCGLGWAIRWHAETCESRGHRVQWQQRYVTGPITNGRPASERHYPRYSLGRYPMPSAEASGPPQTAVRASGTAVHRDRKIEVGVYCTDDGTTLVFTSPTGRSARVPADDLPADLVSRCNRAIWDCTPVEVTRDQMALIRDLAASVSEPNPADLAMQQAIGLMPPAR